MLGIMALPSSVGDRRADAQAGYERVGEASALTIEALYGRYMERIYAYLRARTAIEEDAADLTQQVFVQALGALPGYRGGEGQAAAWLFRIARNLATSAHRRSRPTTAWDLVPEALHVAGDPNIDARLLRQEAHARLRTLLQALPVEGQELLALRFVARLTVAEIAAVIGKSEAATSKRLSRTMQRLQERYDDDAR